MRYLSDSTMLRTCRPASPDETPSRAQRTRGGIAEAVSPYALRDIASGVVEITDGCFSVYEVDGACVLALAGAGWSGPSDSEEARREAAAAAEGGGPVEAPRTGGMASLTLPVPGAAGPAGAVRAAWRHAGADLEAVRRGLAAAARLVGALAEAGAGPRRLEAIGESLDAANGADGVLEAAAGGLLEWSGAEAGVLVLAAGNTGGPLTRAAAGSPPAALEVLEPAAAAVLRSGEAVFEPSAALPLGIPGRPAALALAFPAGSLSAARRGFLGALAGAIGGALERALLREAEARGRRFMEEVFQSLPVSAVDLSGPSHIAESVYGRGVPAWIGSSGGLAGPLAAAADLVYRTGEPCRLAGEPASARGRDGGSYDFTLLPRRGAAGEVIGVTVLAIDVSEQVRARAELEEQHAFLEAVLEQMPSGAVIAEAPSGRILLFNSEGKRLLRHDVPPVEHTREYALFQAVHPDGSPYRPEDYPLVRSLTRGEQIHQEDMTYRRGDGSTAVLSINAKPIRNADGRIVAAACTFNDITERRRERDALRRQSQLITMSRDAIVGATADRVITAWNAGAEEIYGWSATEALGKVIDKLLRTRSPVAVEEIDAVLRRDGRWDGELLHTRKDGAEIVVESAQALVRENLNGPAGLLLINRDVTARKRDEEALRESERWLLFCQQATGVGIADFNLITGTSKCSDQLYKLYGFEPGARAFDLDAWMNRVHPQDRDRVAARLQAAKEGREPFETEFRVVAPGLPERWIGATAAFYFDDGRPVRAVAAALDITARKRSEEAHHSAQRLESVGLLAGGVAHDFNNLLTAVIGNASLLLPDAPPEMGERLGAIMEGAQKAAGLTRQLLAYAGKGRYVVREVDLAGLVRDMTDLLRASIPKRVELRRELHGARVRADAGQTQQIVMSLVMNSAEAMGEGKAGTVAVTTGVEHVREPLTGAAGDTLPPGSYAFLEVSDNGCGMDPATRARIFDPFFTTKFVGRGMGLAAVAGIVRSHKGAIVISTEPGKGTTLRVLLPAVDSLPAPAPPAVLVVDDEEPVRAFLQRVLEGRGFAVACAANGREALRILDERPEGIALVILDVMMPVMSGGEVLASIRARRPGLKVLLTSGYSEDEAQRLCGAPADAEFIQKPYTAQQLAEKVRSVLEA